MPRFCLLLGLSLLAGLAWAGHDVPDALRASGKTGQSLLADNSVRINAELQGPRGEKTLAGVIRFDRGPSVVPGGAAEVLDDIAQRLKADRHLDVVLIGRVDLSGSWEYGVALSEQRVSAVEAELLQRGVRKSQIRRNISGHADSESCASSECLRAALDVEMHLTD